MRYLAVLRIILTSTVCFTIAAHGHECGIKFYPRSCACTSNTARVLQYLGGYGFMFCDGNNWKALQFENLGSRNNPGYSCKDILANRGQTADGNYWITLSNRKEAFQVYCDMTSGGWTMVFQAWSGADNTAFDDYNKGRIVMNWGDFDPSEARVVLYKDWFSVKELKFNATGSDKLNWFSKDKLTESPWNDVKTEPRNVFSIEGFSDRNFYISRNHGGCDVDAGWMVITGPHCDWEKRFLNEMPNGNVILYSKLAVYTTWSQDETVGKADSLAVYLR